MDVRSRNPVTGEVVYSTRAVTRGKLDSALMTAVDAWPAWAATPVAQRAQILNAFADLVDEHRDRLATSITAEVGKRSSDSAAEVEWTALSARWYAEHPPEEEELAGALICRVPLGVIAAVTPWNVPLVTPSWKWLPALMAGNAVVWKPSELATGIAVEAASLFEQAGLPPGLLQVLPGGADVARWLCADPRVAGVHFTGSTRAGRALNQLVAPRFARIALEMGGVNAAVVFADADLERAAEAIISSATALAGQKCTAVRRVLVHREVANGLTDELRRRMETLVVGAPGCDGTDVGPMVSGAARRSAEATLDAAVSRGASVLARAKRSQDATAEAYFPPRTSWRPAARRPVDHRRGLRPDPAPGGLRWAGRVVTSQHRRLRPVRCRLHHRSDDGRSGQTVAVGRRPGRQRSQRCSGARTTLRWPRPVG